MSGYPEKIYLRRKAEHWVSYKPLSKVVSWRSKSVPD